MANSFSHYGILLTAATSLFCTAGLAPARAAQHDGKPSTGHTRVLAIGPLGDSSGAGRLGFLVADYALEGLNRKGNLRVVNRELIGQVIGELHLQNTGVTDLATAKQVGKLANADYSVYGTVNSCVVTPPEERSTRKGKRPSFSFNPWSASVNASIHCVEVETGVELPGEVVYDGKSSGSNAETVRQAALRDVAYKFANGIIFPVKASVVYITAETKKFAIDAGSDSGVGVGDHFQVYRPGLEIKKNGLVIGRDDIEICQGKVFEVQPGLAFLEAGEYSEPDFFHPVPRWKGDSKKLALIKEGDLAKTIPPNTKQRKTGR
jgi:hypothetical protein